MIYIDKQPNLSGAYSNPKCQPFPDCIPLNDEQAAVFFEYNGFVTIQDGVVTPNVEAWEAWKATLPEPTEPEPTTEERVDVLEQQLAETDEVAIDLYEASLKQDTINAEQDEAIIEIYEMMEEMNNG